MSLVSVLFPQVVLSQLLSSVHNLTDVVLSICASSSCLWQVVHRTRGFLCTDTDHVHWRGQREGSRERPTGGVSVGKLVRARERPTEGVSVGKLARARERPTGGVSGEANRRGLGKEAGQGTGETNRRGLGREAGQGTGETNRRGLGRGQQEGSR